MSLEVGRSPNGVPWSEVHFKAGAQARSRDEHPQVNPWTPGTHAFESWKAGYEAEGTRQKVKQHEHECHECRLTFNCRGKACSGNPDTREVYCAYCWSVFSD